MDENNLQPKRINEMLPRIENSSVTGQAGIFIPAPPERLHEAQELITKLEKDAEKKPKEKNGLSFAKDPTALEDVGKFYTLASKVSAQDYAGNDGKYSTWNIIRSAGLKNSTLRFPSLVDNSGAVPTIILKVWDGIVALLSEANAKWKNSEPKVTSVTFKMKDFLTLLPYSREEVKKGGHFITRHTKALIDMTGAVGEMYIDKGGEKYRRVGIEPVYHLDIPDKKGGDWTVSLNPTFAKLYAENNQYNPLLLSELHDKATSGQGESLYLFHKVLVRYYGGRGKMFVFGKTLLREMDSPWAERSPKESYEVLAKHIAHYVQKGHITSVEVKIGKGNAVAVPVETFGAVSYEEFQKIVDVDPRELKFFCKLDLKKMIKGGK